MWWLVLPLFLVPTVEVVFAANLGLRWPILLLITCGTMGLGAWVVRREDLSLWAELESDVQNHRVPTEEGLDAMLMVLGGWALLVPGLLTDGLGAALLAPPVRQLLIPFIRQWIRERLI